MDYITCPFCGRSITNQDVVCPGCGHPLQEPSLIERLNQIPPTGKLALVGVIIFIPSFLFSFGATPMLLGLTLIGLAFFLFLIKVGI